MVGDPPFVLSHNKTFTKTQFFNMHQQMFRVISIIGETMKPYQEQTITNSTCIVTGGAGFIGSNLTRNLAKEKHNNKVIVIDDLSTGHISNIQNLIDSKSITFIDTGQSSEAHAALTDRF